MNETIKMLFTSYSIRQHFLINYVKSFQIQINVSCLFYYKGEIEEEIIQIIVHNWRPIKPLLYLFKKL